jgi:hypothetical protein
VRCQTITVHRAPSEVRTFTLDDTLDAEPVVPGWRLAVTEVFA